MDPGAQNLLTFHFPANTLQHKNAMFCAFCFYFKTGSFEEQAKKKKKGPFQEPLCGAEAEKGFELQRRCFSNERSSPRCAKR